MAVKKNTVASVDFHVAVDIDSDVWMTNYGITEAVTAQGIRDDVRNHLGAAIQEFLREYIDRTGNTGTAFVRTM